MVELAIECLHELGGVNQSLITFGSLALSYYHIPTPPKYNESPLLNSHNDKCHVVPFHGNGTSKMMIC